MKFVRIFRTPRDTIQYAVLIHTVARKVAIHRWEAGVTSTSIVGEVTYGDRKKGVSAASTIARKLSRGEDPRNAQYLLEEEMSYE